MRCVIGCDGEVNAYLCFMNSQEKLTAHLIKEKINQKDPTAEVILFGSRARGESNKESDWDILILTNENNVTRNTEREYRDELFDIELETGETISTFVISKTEWEQKYLVTPLYHSIQKEGIHL